MAPHLLLAEICQCSVHLARNFGCVLGVNAAGATAAPLKVWEERNKSFPLPHQVTFCHRKQNWVKKC